MAKESPLSFEEALRLSAELDFSAVDGVGPRTRTLEVSGMIRFEVPLSPPELSLVSAGFKPGLTQHVFFSKFSYSTDSNTGRILLP